MNAGIRYNSWTMKHLRLLVFAILTLLPAFAQTPAKKSSGTPEQRTARYFESIKKNPASDRALFYRGSLLKRFQTTGLELPSHLIRCFLQKSFQIIRTITFQG